MAFPTTDRGDVYYDPNWMGGAGWMSSGAVVTIAIGKGECLANYPNDCAHYTAGQCVPVGQMGTSACTIVAEDTPWIISAIHSNAQCNWLTSVCR